MMGHRGRLRLIAARQQCSDVLPGDFVRLVSGSTLGLIESMEGDHAVVVDLSKVGHREILPTCILVRACEP